MLLKSQHACLRRGVHSFLSFSSSQEPAAATQDMPGDLNIPMNSVWSQRQKNPQAKLRPGGQSFLQVQHAIPDNFQGA